LLDCAEKIVVACAIAKTNNNSHKFFVLIFRFIVEYLQLRSRRGLFSNGDVANLQKFLLLELDLWLFTKIVVVEITLVLQIIVRWFHGLLFGGLLLCWHGSHIFLRYELLSNNLCILIFYNEL